MGAGRLPICLWGLLPPGAVQKEHVPQTCGLLEPHETQWPTQKKQVAKESKRVLRVLSICRGSHANPTVCTPSVTIIGCLRGNKKPAMQRLQQSARSLAAMLTLQEAAGLP